MNNKDLENINNTERVILGGIFRDNSFYDELFTKGITPELFYNEQNKKIFSVIKAMQEKKLTVDIMTFNSYITENKLYNNIDISYVAGLTDELPSTANGDYYINQFIKHYKERTLNDKLKELLNKEKTGETEKQIENVIRELNDLNNNIFYNLTNEDYEKNNAFSDLCNFANKLENGETKDPIKTGFNNLDYLLDGGLFTGLYTIGAISSAGKTTLCLQIADQIAKAGKDDVLIFSLEMAKEELMSKSLSRTTYQKDKLNAVTTREILKFNKKDLGNDKIINLNNALQIYGNYAKNIFFNIGIGDIGTEKIRKVINTHIHHRKRNPVVFIDYLQILAPPSDRLTDKQILDKNIVELKRIARDFDIPVIAISSFNRESYKNEVSLSSFKESGAIEYTADVLIGLQPLGMTNDETKNKKLADYNNGLARDGKEYPIELKVLKYRTGAKSTTELLYKPKYETFRAPNEDENRKALEDGIKYVLDHETPPAGNQNNNVSKKGKQNILAMGMQK